jgi:hypothetical protein
MCSFLARPFAHAARLSCGGSLDPRRRVVKENALTTPSPAPAGRVQKGGRLVLKYQNRKIGSLAVVGSMEKGDLGILRYKKCDRVGRCFFCFDIVS